MGEENESNKLTLRAPRNGVLLDCCRPLLLVFSDTAAVFSRKKQKQKRPVCEISNEVRFRTSCKLIHKLGRRTDIMAGSHTEYYRTHTAPRHTPGIGLDNLLQLVRAQRLRLSAFRNYGGVGWDRAMVLVSLGFGLEYTHAALARPGGP